MIQLRITDELGATLAWDGALDEALIYAHENGLEVAWHEADEAKGLNGWLEAPILEVLR